MVLKANLVLAALVTVDLHAFLVFLKWKYKDLGNCK